MTNSSELTGRAARRLLVLTVALCLFSLAGGWSAAQPSATSSPTNLHGRVCLTKLKNKKPTTCEYRSDILVNAFLVPEDMRQQGDVPPSSSRTDSKGKFSFWFDQTGRYSLSARFKGYALYGSNIRVWLKDKKTIVDADPIYLTGFGTGANRRTSEIILVLFQVESPDRERGSVQLRPTLAQDKPNLSGQVVGNDDRPISGALVSVLVTKRETNRLVTLAEARTNKEGFYKLSAQALGESDEYVISVTREGFDRFVTVFDRDEGPPQTIVLGETSFADEPLLERSESTRRHVFTPRVMETLPVAGLRNFDSFALLAPGVAPPPDTPNTRGLGVSPGLGTAGQFSVNGLRSRENNFTIDGSDNNDEDIGTRRQGFVVLAPQAIESLNEFQIVTALGDARFGRNIGGHVNALTKSGTPKLHGSVYGFLTDSSLNARGYFDQSVGNNPASFTLRRQSDGAQVFVDGRPVVTPNPSGGEDALTQTQLGFAVGGPIKVIDSSFFASLEHVKTRASRESHFIVPTVEQRGAFDSGATGLLIDRIAGEPVLPAPLPLYAASVPGNAIFSLYPFPNNRFGPFGHNTYTTSLPADSKGTRLSGKLDRQFGEFDGKKSRRPWSFFKRGDTLTGRYNFSQEKSIVPVTGEALFSSLRPQVRTQNIALYLNRRLTNRVSDVIRFSYGRTKLDFGEARDPFLSPSGFFPSEQFLLNAPLLLNVTAPLPNGALTPPTFVSASSAQGANLFAALGFPGITQTEQITGALGQVIIPGFSPLGVDVYNFPQSRANSTIQIADTVTYFSRPGRIFTFGVDIKKSYINSTLERNFRPQAVFSGLRTSAPSSELPARLPGGPPLTPRVYSGTTLAAAGVPTGLFQALAVNPDSSVGIRYAQISFFEQTDWRIGDHLTVNVGARFNHLTGLKTKGNKIEDAFNPSELERQTLTAIEDCSRVSGNRPDCHRAARAIASAFPPDFAAAYGEDRYDLDLRVGAAWSLGEKTVVRGGVGTYSGEFPGIVLGQSRNVFPNFLPLNFADFPYSRTTSEVFLFNPSNPLLRREDPTLALAPNTLNMLPPNVNAISLLTTRLVGGLPSAESPFSRSVLVLDLVQTERGLQNPYSVQYAVTLERQLSRRYAVSVAYVGTRGVKLLRLATPKFGPHHSHLSEPPGLKVIRSPESAFPVFGGGFDRPVESVPSARLAIARTIFEGSASSTYNSLQIELRKHYAQRFQFRTAFTYSHAIDDASDFFDTSGAFALPQDSLNRSERGSSNFDVRLRSVTHFVRDFPKDLFFFSPSKFGGWQVAGIVTAQTGQPYTVNSAFDINRDGNLTDRLDTTARLIRGGATEDRSVQLSLTPGTNPLDLLAADGRSGSVGRNTFRAPKQFSFDLSITKFFNFNERVRLHARTEIFNLFNRTNFGIPVRILESPAFGRSTYTTTPPRTIHLVVKFLF